MSTLITRRKMNCKCYLNALFIRSFGFSVTVSSIVVLFWCHSMFKIIHKSCRHRLLIVIVNGKFIINDINRILSSLSFEIEYT